MSAWRWFALGTCLCLAGGACSKIPDPATCVGPAPGSSKTCPGGPGVALQGAFAPGAAASPTLAGHFLFYGAVKQQQGGIAIEGRLQ